jgi:MoxR-like ATPase
MRVSLGFPEPAYEKQLLLKGDARAQLPKLNATITADELRTMQANAAKVQVSEALAMYVHRLLVATRTGAAGLGHGLSPRAGLSLLAAARAHALLSGQTYVAPDDVQAVFIAVAGHRMPGGNELAARVLSSTPT